MVVVGVYERYEMAEIAAIRLRQAGIAVTLEHAIVGGSGRESRLSVPAGDAQLAQALLESRQVREVGDVEDADEVKERRRRRPWPAEVRWGLGVVVVLAVIVPLMARWIGWYWAIIAFVLPPVVVMMILEQRRR
jgi:uncharacterized membrane protein YdbT with pleckstrin-like domain